MGTTTIAEDFVQKTIRELSKIPDLAKQTVRGSERFLYHGIPIVFALITAYTSLPSQQSSAVTNISETYVPGYIRMSQNYLEAPPQPYTLTEAVQKEMAQFQQNEQAAIDRTLSKLNLIQETINNPRFNNLSTKQQEALAIRMLAITFIESKGLPQAFSGEALGLTQVTPNTAKDVSKRLNKPNFNLYNEKDSMLFGTIYMQELIDAVGLDYSILAYNWGLGRVITAKYAYPGQTYMSSRDLFKDPTFLKIVEANKIPIEEAKIYMDRFQAAEQIFSKKLPSPLQTKG
ncbi:transglycosylase SLT domain-containing protein [Candidatus Daviesbacteria bacterium]|nr:transglycosylase SLT domain-containing protein [Candidatus Daviesbacteria bacterium]